MTFGRRLGNSDNEASAKFHTTLKLYSLKTPHTTRNRPLLITYNTKYKAKNVWNVSHYSDIHDDVIKWKHFPRHRPFVRGIHRSPVNSPHKGQWRGALMFTLICARINGWVNNRDAGDLSRYRTHYTMTDMIYCPLYEIYRIISPGLFVYQCLSTIAIYPGILSFHVINDRIAVYPLFCL